MKPRKNVAIALCAAFAWIATSVFSQQTEPAPPSAGGGAFEFKDGDRVVLLGNTVIEREQRYAWFETWLSLALGEKKVAVRNLGWSGDTVFGDARSYFGPPKEGIERLTKHLELIKPTVVLFCYGSDMAHGGLKGLPDFLTGYRALLDLVREKSPGARLIVMSPPPLETLAPPLPDQSDANANLQSLTDALAKFSRMQNARFVDLFTLMGGVPKKGRAAKPLTENGVHYTDEGYQVLVGKVIESLGLTRPDVPTTALSALRDAVRAKDTLFFNRWRPHNETYLFGFRKHEQGQNAKEIPMFDPLIAEADKKVQAAKAKVLGEAKRP